MKKFRARNGKAVTLRTPRWEDLDDLLDCINSLVAERADIMKTEPVTRDQEMVWLGSLLTKLEMEQTFYVVADVEGKVVANSEIGKREGYQKHTGIIGIAIRDGFRDIGIGTEMMNALVNKGKEWRLKLLVLTVFGTNSRARHVYEKVGFREVAKIPGLIYKDGTYIDNVIMIKELE